MSETLDPGEWQRGTRGREVQFLATDEEVRGWLVRAREMSGLDLSLVGNDVVREGPRRWTRLRFNIPIDAIAASPEGQARHHGNLWVWDRSRVPGIAGVGAKDLDRVCSINGLVLVQMPRCVCGEVSGTGRFALTTTVVNSEQETIRHVDSERLFEMLKRVAGRELVYRTLVRMGDGTEAPDEIVRMTRAMADRWRPTWRWRPDRGSSGDFRT